MASGRASGCTETGSSFESSCSPATVLGTGKAGMALGVEKLEICHAACLGLPLPILLLSVLPLPVLLPAGGG